MKMDKEKINCVFNCMKMGIAGIVCSLSIYAVNRGELFLAIGGALLAAYIVIDTMIAMIYAMSRRP